jgi:hypothetical protein
MADPNDAMLRQRIVDLLRSNSCQRVDFRFGPYHIDGWCYLRVALAAISPVHDFHVAAVEQSIDPGASAQYSARTNTFKVPRGTFATGADPQVAHPPFGLSSDAVLGFQRMTIVHECTHAAIDQMLQHPTIFRRSNEVIAYVAAALFNLYEGNPFDAMALPATRSSRPSLVAAQTIAGDIANRPGSPIGPRAGIVILEQALEVTQFYHRRFHDLPIAINSSLRF